MTAVADRDFGAQLTGYSLTTAEILYRMPDHPSLLQSYDWQKYDIHPRFPRLKQTLSRHRVPQAAHHAGRVAVGR